ncbi:CIA30 family protein [Croceivirga thetidis]|uniref:CIA30 family protein n=1 Tax=Croceivirga thetidis TaxID=2721623 RepID=A0ABX1GRV7_9FLAO|nr:CIA30 family protein [Croceivirga thetidis]NKI32677.1 CIA30 family protein [Croceivirga thetidis]
MNAQIVFDSQNNPKADNWYVVDDVVMGGRSNGHFELTPEGHAKFFGEVSLENNGGFSSVRYAIPETKVSLEATLKIRLKGDGNRYQLRIKDQESTYHNYITYFETSGDWQTLQFKVKDLYPTFRGRRLNLPNFNHQTIGALGFLIGNKIPQQFQLTIAKIEIVN